MRLGERMDIVSFALRGDCSRFGATHLIEEIIRTLNMNKAHSSVTYGYPVGNCGGVGFTTIQPITESFVAVDSWPDFKGIYLIICSCRTVNLNKVTKKIRALGYKIKKVCANELRLGNGLQ